MKFPSKKNSNGHRVATIDENRSNKLSRSFDTLSQSKRRLELDKAGNKPFRRPLKLTIKKTRRSAVELADENKSQNGVNVSGNRRGMHAANDSDKMRRVRAMRRIYRNKQLPVLQCSNCAYSQQCPSYKAGYECAYLPFLNSHGIENEKDVIYYTKEFIAAQIRRVHLASIMETMAGAAPSLELSEQYSITIEKLQNLLEQMRESEESEVTLEGDETIIGRLFGDVDNLIADTKQAQLEYQNEVISVPRMFKNDGDVIDIEVETIPEIRKSNTNEELAREFEKEELELSTQPGATPLPSSTSLVVSELKA